MEDWALDPLLKEIRRTTLRLRAVYPIEQDLPLAPKDKQAVGLYLAKQALGVRAEDNLGLCEEQKQMLQEIEQGQRPAVVTIVLDLRNSKVDKLRALEIFAG